MAALIERAVEKSLGDDVEVLIATLHRVPAFSPPELIAQHPLEDLALRVAR